MPEQGAGSTRWKCYS